jgi:hypothetical protein
MFRALLVHPQEAGATQSALGILHACYVSWLHKGWSGTELDFTPCAAN